MKLTQKLAYNQLTKSRKRTLWTLLGIALSTAMITAVYGFAASGSAAVTALLDDGMNIDNYIRTLYGLGAVLSAIVVAASIIVISNAFRVSAGERTRQFGMLKSIGATKRQIIETVMNEGLFLSIIAVPAGILLGLFVQFAALQIANYLLIDLNAINNERIVFNFVVAWQAILISVVISFITVMLSAWLPARKAAKIAAIDAIRGAGEINLQAKQIRANPIVKKLFGIEGVLASTSLKRNKRNLRATVISLTISIIMFIAVSSFGAQMNRMTNLVFHMVDANVIGTFHSSLQRHIISEEGAYIQKYSTISEDAAENITARLREFPDTAVFGAGANQHCYIANIPGDMLTQEMLNYYNSPASNMNEDDTLSLSVVLMTVDTENYAKLCKRAGVPPGSNILVNYYRLRIVNKWTEITPLVWSGQTLFMRNMDDPSLDLSIDLPLHGEIGWEAPNEVLWFAGHSITVIVPSLDSISYVWFATAADPYAFEDYILAVFDEMIPRDGEIPVNTNAMNNVREENAMRSIYRFIMLFIFGFVGMLTLIGLTNVISAISTNVHSRAREFAVLRSVGMTHDGLNRMLNLESILCSAKSLIIGLPLGIGAAYLIYLAIIDSVDFTFEFPWLTVAECIFAVFIITWITMRYSAARLRDGNIVETIRAESGV